MSLEFLLASAIGTLAAAGFWLILRTRTFDVILGFTLAKDPLPNMALAYFCASVAVLLYQSPWREWVLG